MWTYSVQCAKLTFFLKYNFFSLFSILWIPSIVHFILLWVLKSSYTLLFTIGLTKGATQFFIGATWFFASRLPDGQPDFYTPVWKTDVLCRGNVRPSVCPSVRPSVRPGFPDFSSTCFEISIWNLVYTFSKWHNMSSLSCITIGSLWPSLQLKVGQTHFLQSWPHKSR